MEVTLRHVRKLVDRLLPRHLRLALGPQSEYGLADYCRVLEYAAENGTSVSDAATHLRSNDQELPDGDTVLRRFGQVDWKALARGFLGLWERQLRLARRWGLFDRPLELAIDLNDQPWYGEDLPFVVRGEARDGTTKFLRFAAVAVVTEGRRFVLGVLPVFPDSSKVELVELLLAHSTQWVKVLRVYLDRGFYSVDILTMLQENRIGYVVGARMTEGVQRALRRCQKRGEVATRYEVRSPTDSVETTLFFVQDEDGEWHSFVTNMGVDRFSAPRLAEKYRRRWGIETAFRVKNGFRARSSGRTYSLRYALYMLAMAFYNFWVLANALLARRQGRWPDEPELKAVRFRLAMVSLLFPGIR